MNGSRFAITALAVCLFAEALLAQTPAGVSAVLPVVGSTGGAFGSHFKTQLQMNNRTEERMTGMLVYHAQGAEAAVGDPLIHYDLAPHATRAFEDVVADFGRTGLGTIDVVVESGQLPTIVARAYDDQESGTTGATITLIAPDEALSVGESGSLIVPANLQKFRFNVGVRTLLEGATIRVIVRSQSGIARLTSEESVLPANWFVQRPGNAFAGTTLLANESIGIEVLRGSVIVYGTTVDNKTNDSSIQIIERPE